MGSSRKKKSPPQKLSLEGDMTIYRAQELKQTLLAAVDRSAALEVDLSRVCELDSAGVQLLMLAKKEAQAKGHEFCLVSHSAEVLDVFDLLNLGPYFGDPLLMAPRTP